MRRVRRLARHRVDGGSALGCANRAAASALWALPLWITFVTSCAPVPRPVSPAEPTGGSRPAPAGTIEPVQVPRFDLRREPQLDVGLAWDLDSLALAIPAGARLEFLRAGGGRDERPSRDGGALIVRLRPSGGASLATSKAGASEPKGTLAIGDTLFVHGQGGTQVAHATGWSGRMWRGTFKIFVNPRGKITLADRLALETYLLGVVPGEIGALDGTLIEAGRAQAIAARSYTLFYRGRREAEGFDLFGTVEDQFYGSIETERPLASKCVEETSGMLALAGGFPIRANYCSTCGGITAEVWEAWPAASLGYLTSHPDHGAEDWCAASPQYRWREAWPAAEFMANLQRFAPVQGVPLPPGGLGDLIDVRVDARSRSGRVWRLIVQTTSGDVTLPAYSIRQVLRRAGNTGAILRSNLFKIDVVRLPLTRRAVQVVASGAGSGHGVGLCQTGALGMARSGAKAGAILQHYYPGIEIERRY